MKRITLWKLTEVAQLLRDAFVGSDSQTVYRNDTAAIAQID